MQIDTPNGSNILNASQTDIAKRLKENAEMRRFHGSTMADSARIASITFMHTTLSTACMMVLGTGWEVIGMYEPRNPKSETSAERELQAQEKAMAILEVDLAYLGFMAFKHDEDKGQLADADAAEVNAAANLVGLPPGTLTTSPPTGEGENPAPPPAHSNPDGSTFGSVGTTPEPDADKSKQDGDQDGDQDGYQGGPGDADPTTPQGDEGKGEAPDATGKSEEELAKPMTKAQKKAAAAAAEAAKSK